MASATVIPGGQEALRIGSLSLEALRIPLEFVETLHRWGIHTCAEFAGLPEIAIVERLGQEGLRWWRLAQGADAHPLIAKDFPVNFEEHMDLESPVELLEPLLFVLNRLLEQLCVRLRMHIAIGEIKVTLTLERQTFRVGGEWQKQSELLRTRLSFRSSLLSRAGTGSRIVRT